MPIDYTCEICGKKPEYEEPSNRMPGGWSYHNIGSVTLLFCEICGYPLSQGINYPIDHPDLWDEVIEAAKKKKNLAAK